MQEVNIEQLEENFGVVFAKKITKEIAYCKEKNNQFKFEQIEETKNFITFAFATSGYSYVYEISKNRKLIVSENYIGWREANEVAKLMNSL